MQYSTEITKKLADLYGVYSEIGSYDENLRFYKDISFIKRRGKILMNYVETFEILLSRIEKVSDLYKRKFNFDNFKRKKLLEIDLKLLLEKYPTSNRENQAKSLLRLEEILYNSLSKFIKSQADLLISK